MKTTEKKQNFSFPTTQHKDKIGDNRYVAEYNGVKCTAIYNPFVGRYYVDDKFGVIRDKAPARTEPCR